MSPVMNTIQGAGVLELLGTNIKGSNTLNLLSDALKTDKLRELNIKNTKLEFSLVDGRVVIKPFDLTALNTSNKHWRFERIRSNDCLYYEA